MGKEDNSRLKKLNEKYSEALNKGKIKKAKRLREEIAALQIKGGMVTQADASNKAVIAERDMSRRHVLVNGMQSKWEGGNARD